jgi:hypothetical protein
VFVVLTLMRLAGDVVLLADELVVVQHIELLARAELLATHHAREAVEVKHLLASLAHQVARRDTLRTASALGAVPPANKHDSEDVSETQMLVAVPAASKPNKQGVSESRVLGEAPPESKRNNQGVSET